MRVDWHISAGAIPAQLGALEELTLLNLNNNQLMLRGKLLTLVNSYPFTRVTEWSSLQMWRRRQDQSRGFESSRTNFLCKEKCA